MLDEQSFPIHLDFPRLCMSLVVRIALAFWEGRRKHGVWRPRGRPYAKPTTSAVMKQIGHMAVIVMDIYETSIISGDFLLGGYDKT